MMSIDTYPGEPDNQTRAMWAHAALVRYAKLTHGNEPGVVDDSEGIAIVAAELFGDLLHLLISERVRLGVVLGDAFSTFAEECEEEGVRMCNPLAMLERIAYLAGKPGAYFDRMVEVLDCLDSEGWHDTSNPYAA